MKVVKGVNIRKELVSGFPEAEAEVKATVLGNHPSEPARAVGASASVIVALTGLLQVLFPNALSGDSWSLVYYLIAFATPLITTALTRKKVWSPASVQEVLDAALEEANKLNRQS